MSPDIYVESMSIGYAFLWGVWLAFIYDGILIFRNLFTHKNIFIYLEDFVYWILCAIFVFESLYEIGNGHIRWYIALFVGIGMLSYKLLISKWIVKGISFVLGKILWFFKKVLSYLFGPFVYMAGKIRRIFRFFRTKILLGLRLLKKKLTLSVKMLKITLCKHKE